MMTTSTEALPAQAGLDTTKGMKNSLSTADVLEINKFAEGKTRIVDLTAVLSSKPIVDPFEGFIRIDEEAIPSNEAISNAWADLEGKLDQVMKWQDERDDIEAEAMQFEVGDMERLRKVAKAATEREMSSRDTDLIEITIQTLTALDTLLRLLNSRREALDVLQGRLRWEERRKDCWTTYASLKHDLDDMVKQARWSPQIYQRNVAENDDVDDMNMQVASTSDWSPLTARSSSGITTTSNAKKQGIKVKTQSIALQSRCRSFVEEIVPLASKQLDDLIEQRQVPDAFLDEQDRLEDLAENIKAIEIFMIQLSIQWRKADETFRQLRSLHTQGRQLNSVLNTAQQEVPTSEKVADYCAQRDLLQQKLEVLSGTQIVSSFLSDAKVSAHLLIDSIQDRIPAPLCESWPDQERYSKEIKRILAKEMASAAKHVRSACLSADKYEKGLSCFGKCQKVTAQLKEAAGVLLNVGQKARQGWNVEASDQQYLSPNLSSIDSSTTQKYEAYIEAIPKLLEQFEEVKREVHRNILSMEELFHDCIRAGLSHSLYRREAEKAIQKVKTAELEAQSAVQEAAKSADLLKEIVLGDIQLLQLEEDCRTCLEAEASVLVMRAEASPSSLRASTSNAVQIAEIQGRVEALSQRTKELRTKLNTLTNDLKSEQASQLIQSLFNRSSVVQENIGAVQANCHWLQAMNQQYTQLKDLKGEHDRLTRIGLQAKADLLDVEVPGEDSACGSNHERMLISPLKHDNVRKEIRQYISATHNNLVLCGPIPDSLNAAWTSQASKSASLPAFDDIARQSINQWCLLLSSLDEEIELNSQCDHQSHQNSRGEGNDVVSRQEQLNSAMLSSDTTRGEVTESGAGVLNDDSRRAIQRQEELPLDILSDPVEQGECSLRLMPHLDRCKEMISRNDDVAQSLPILTEGQAKSEPALIGEAITSRDETAPLPADSSYHEYEEKENQERVDFPIIYKTSTLQEEKDRLLQDVAFIRNVKPDRYLKDDAKQKSDPLPLPSTYTQLKGTEMIEDVFGPMPLRETFSMSQIAKVKSNDKIQMSTDNVKEKVRELLADCSKYSVEEQIQPNGKIQLQSGLALPTLEQAEVLNREWKEASLRSKSVFDTSTALTTNEVEQMRMAIQAEDAKVRRFFQLATFGAQQSATEEALSRLLNILDQSAKNESEEEMQNSLGEVRKSISQANLAAEPVLTDVRVRYQLSQLRHSYQDMAAMVRDACSLLEGRKDGDDSRSTCPSRSSSISSLPSLTGSASEIESFYGEQRQMLPSLLKVSTPSRSAASIFAIPEVLRDSQRRVHSSSSGTYATAPQSTPRQVIDRRVVSEGISMFTPSRIPMSTSRSNVNAATPKSTVVRPSSSSGSTVSLAKLSTHSQRLQESTKLPTRSPAGISIRSQTPQGVTSSSFSSSSSKPNQYRANPKSKLDIAVGKIVNKLPMPVNITHASAGGSTNRPGSDARRIDEQWHDESGRYWVGQPDPKLCFCRILRSRTVMVRVGGGWQELTTYILKHFSHLDNGSSLSVAASPHVSPQIDRGKTDKLPWISSKTLIQQQHQTPTGKDGSVKTIELSPESAYLTPVHERGEQVGSGSFRRASRRPSSAAATSPSILSTAFQKTALLNNADEMHGLWIRRERKISESSAISDTPSFSHDQYPRHLFKEGKRDLTRSTLASRSRVVSRNISLSSGRSVDIKGQRMESLSLVKNHKSAVSNPDEYKRIRAESIHLVGSNQ